LKAKRVTGVTDTPVDRSKVPGELLKSLLNAFSSPLMRSMWLAADPKNESTATSVGPQCVSATLMHEGRTLRGRHRERATIGKGDSAVAIANQFSDYQGGYKGIFE
jgi:hypothetical protein